MTTEIDEIVTRVGHLIRDRADQYYPCLRGEQLEVAVQSIQVRQFAVLCEWKVVSGHWNKTLLAKIKKDDEVDPLAVDRGVHESYFVPRPDRKGAEYEAMSKIQRNFDALADPRFFSVPVLDSLIDDRVLVLEKVPVRSCKRMLRSCANPVLPTATRHRMWEVVQRTGSWLRNYHQMGRHEAGTERGTQNGDFLNWIHAAETFLSQQGHGRKFLQRTERRMRQAAHELLPEQLPSSTLHNDFAPRNVLIDHQGRIGAIDTLMEWRGCVWEDIAHFVVSIHTNKLRTLSCGVLFSKQFFDELECRFVESYFGVDPVPWPAIRLYQAQVALTKWAAMVHAQQRKRYLGRASRLTISSRQFAAYIDDRLQRMDQSIASQKTSMHRTSDVTRGER